MIQGNLGGKDLFPFATYLYFCYVNKYVNQNERFKKFAIQAVGLMCGDQ